MAGIPRPLKILVVDDDKVLNRTVEFRLRKAGFITEAVLDGKAALAAFGKTAFDLIILDLVMPGTPGLEVLKEIRKKNTQIPVAILSLLHQEEDMRRVSELGATKYFTKSSPNFMDDIIAYAEEVSRS